MVKYKTLYISTDFSVDVTVSQTDENVYLHIHSDKEFNPGMSGRTHIKDDGYRYAFTLKTDPDLGLIDDMIEQLQRMKRNYGELI